MTAQVVFVDHSATGADDGTSWSDAFVDLSIALRNAKAGGEIWVAQGVYKPSFRLDDTPRSSTFLIPSGVAVYGGFKGGETMRGQRDWEIYVTILSGDIDSNDQNADGNFIAELVSSTGEVLTKKIIVSR